METQKFIRNEIEMFGGLPEVLKWFDLMQFPEHKQYHINEMKLFFSLIMQMEIDLLQIAVDKETRILSGLYEFERIHKTDPTEFTEMIIRIINKHLNTIPGRYLLKVV